MLFSKDDVERGLRALAGELAADGVVAQIRVLGGAAVALQVGREALTLDIDAPLPSTPGFAKVVKRVGDANGWPATWLQRRREDVRESLRH